MNINVSRSTLQSLGDVASSALASATEGVSRKDFDPDLKAFGGFDRSTFENFESQGAQPMPVIQNAAEYPKPATMLKQFAQSAGADYMVPFQDVVKHLENPKFEASEGLSSFTAKKMGFDPAQEKGIIVIGGRPGAVPDSSEQKGMVVVDGGPGATPDPTGEKGIIIVNTKPEKFSDLEEKGIIIINNKPEKISDLEEKGIVITGGKPADVLQKMGATAEQQLKLFQSLKLRI